MRHTSLLPQNMQFRRTGVRFLGSKFSKFPVFFPVSREFWRRRVSARLRAPPLRQRVGLSFNYCTAPWRLARPLVGHFIPQFVAQETGNTQLNAPTRSVFLPLIRTARAASAAES